jgi:predicted component of type VI protein secretion system
MLTCSQCRFENTAGAGVCARCGRGLGEVFEPKSAAVTLVDRGRAVEAAVAPPSVAASTPAAVPASDPAAGATPHDSRLARGLPVEELPPAHPSVIPTDTPPPSAMPFPPRLVVVRGERLGVEFAVLDGKNYVGRTGDRAVDIDLEGQEALERTWASRQHAVVTFDHGALSIEDLNSLNGTFVNRARLHPGQPRLLQSGDVVQIGTVQLRVVW